MIASPEGHPSKLPPKAPFENQSGSPCRTVLRRLPPVPETIFPKAPSDTPSNQTLRSFLRNAPRVPKVEPKDSFENDYVPEALPRIPPEAFFETPSEPATCSESRAKHLTS